MKKIFRFLTFLFMTAMIFTTPVLAESNSIKIIINGKLLDTTTISENNRTLVSINSISEELEFNVEYLEGSKIVRIKKDNKSIELEIGSTKARVDNKEVELDVKPFVKDGSVFIPLRFISESLGQEVVWDGDNKIVLVGKFRCEARVEDTFLYFNNEHRYTLSFPNSWKEEGIIETKDGNLYVYDKKSAQRFIEDGYDSFGPVFEIRCSDYPAIADSPYDGDYVLSYRDGKYIEVLFGRDFQFYPETLDSYNKIYYEAEKTLGSFSTIDEDYSIVKDNSENYKTEIQVLNDIIDRFVPENIFNTDEIHTYKKPIPNTSFLFMRIMKNEEEVLIKIETEFNSNGKLIRYHFKDYGYDLKENKLSQSEALKLANDFIKKYVHESMEVIKEPDLYPSLYEKDKHETYGHKDGSFVIVVDLEHGFIECFSYN